MTNKYDQETQQIIADLDKQAKEIQAKIDELKNNANKKNVRWRAERGEDFYIVSGCSKYGNVAYKMTEDFGVCCNFHYDVGDYFETKEEAEKSYRHLIITQKIKDIALRLNNGVEIDWENIYKKKYNIGYGLKYGEYRLLCDYNTTFRSANNIYCLSNKFLETCIKEIGEKELIEHIKGC